MSNLFTQSSDISKDYTYDINSVGKMKLPLQYFLLDMVFNIRLSLIGK